MSTAYEFRRRAREMLGGNIFRGEWLYALLISLLISAASTLSGSSLVGLVLCGPLSVGLSNYFLGRSRRSLRYDTVDPAFDGFRYGFTENMITGILVTVFTVLWSLLLIVPGIIKGISYSLAYYIRCDHPELTATQAIKMSEIMMRGNKLRYFCLQLSFIGWVCVSMLTLGIGVPWVMAYMNAANTEFYEEVRTSQPNIVNP